MALLLAASAVISRLTCRAFRRRPDNAQAIAHYYGVARSWLFWSTFASFAASLLLLGWGSTAVEWATIRVGSREIYAPGGELLVLAPFLLVLIGSWVLSYDAVRIIHMKLVVKDSDKAFFWSRWGFVGKSLRELLIVFLPLLLLITALGMERTFPEMLHKSNAPILSLMAMAGLFIVMPLLLPFILPLRPLPPGRSRDRFEACARRMGFRYRQVYVWETRGGLANALIAGIIPRLRYVVLSDRLLEDLTDEELDAVIGHEMGHAHHGHLLYYGFFILSSGMAVGALTLAFDPPVSGMPREYSTASLVFPMLAFGLYLFLAFGFISRRCERQADVFGCRAGSCGQFDCDGHNAETVYVEHGRGLCKTGINAFIAALNKVLEINSRGYGVPPERAVGAWRRKLKQIIHTFVEAIDQWIHSTIARRTGFLQRVMENPEVERRFQRRFLIMRWAIAMVILGIITTVGFWRGWDVLWKSI